MSVYLIQPASQAHLTTHKYAHINRRTQITVASLDLTAQDGNNLSGSRGNILAEYEDVYK